MSDIGNSKKEGVFVMKIKPLQFNYKIKKKL